MDMTFIFEWSTRYLTRSLRSLVRYRVDHSKIKFISTRGHVISSRCFCDRLTVKRARFLRLLNVLLTAQPQACAGLVLHGFFFFLNRAAVSVRGSSFTRRFFFFNRAAAGVRGSSFARGFLLTAQPQACAGLVLHVVFFFFFVLSVS